MHKVIILLLGEIELKIKKNSAAIALILFMLSFGIFTTQVNAFDLDPGDPTPPTPPPPPPPAKTGRIVITQKVPGLKVVGSQISISFNTLNKADKIYLYIDGDLEKSWSNALSGSYSFTASNSITRHVVRVFAYNSRYEGVKTQQIRLQYPTPTDPVLQNWLTNSSDYARSFSPQDSLYHKQVVWDAAYEVLQYGDYQYSMTDVFSESHQSTLALLHFAEDVLQPQYYGDQSFGDCLTAFEMSMYFNDFDGDAVDACFFVAPGRHILVGSTESSYYEGFDCADFGAFISGMATALNIPSRIVSLVDDSELSKYEHLFAEVWADEINGNNGWMLIDPGHRTSNGGCLSSNTDSDIIRSAFWAGDYDVRILAFIWGLEAGQWGSTSSNVLNCWSRSSRPDNCLVYTDNPWNIVSGSLVGYW